MSVLDVACPKEFTEGCGAAAGVKCEGGFTCTIRYRRALNDAQADAKRLREREAHFAAALDVADGGQYRADWPGAIERLIRQRDEAIASERAHVVEIATERDAHDRLAGELRRGYEKAQADAAAMRNRLANEILRGYSTDSPHARGGCGVECPCGARSDDGDADHIEHRSGCALATDAARPFLALLDAARAWVNGGHDCRNVFGNNAPCGNCDACRLRAAVAAIDGGESK